MFKNLLLLATLALFSTNLFSTTHTIYASSFYYTPSTLNITVGDTVVWINDGGNHNANGNTNTISGESFNNPESFFSNPTNVAGATIYTHAFSLPGTYNYDCSVGNHAEQGMVGTINVVLPTIFEIVENSAAHDTLETAILAASLDATLNGNGTFTLFAPTDDAFNAFEPGYLEILLANTDLLTQVLLHHVHGEVLMASDLIGLDGQTIETLNSDDLTISLTDDGVMTDNATVIMQNLEASNGVVHVIDVVLLPEIPQDITVMDVIAASLDHTILEAALIQVGLDVTLSGNGSFTVFAPNDEAFNNLPEGALDELLADDMMLEQALLYHVHAGLLLSSDLTNEMAIPTVNGADLTAYIDGSSYMINNADVIAANTETTNGIVHTINQVLIDNGTSIDDFYNLNKEEYLHTINLLGKIVDRKSLDKVLIDIYSNGKIIKRFKTTK